MWAVVKCDAYRMGLIEVARTCQDAGAERLCVVETSEAAQLRDAGIDAPIVQIAATPDADIEAGIKLDVVVSIGDIARAKHVSRLATQCGKRAKAHIAVETGTGWWGVTGSDVPAFAREAAGLSNIEWEGVWAHIAGRDSMEAQVRRLHAAIDVLRANGLAVPTVHIGSTGPNVWGLEEGAARIGIGLYGAALGAGSQQERLRTALEISAPIYGIRRFSEPEPLGYGGTYVAMPGQTIVTLRIGYGEGMPKTLAGRGSVMLNGTQCPIVGAIGMNFTMVALPPNATVTADQEAIIVGDAPGVRLEEVAAAAQTIPHNIMTMFGSALSPAYEGAAEKLPQ